MKKILLFFFLFSTVVINGYSQGNNCASATPFCTAVGTPFTFPNNTNTTAQSGPQYGCLGSEPNPEWFFLQTTASGNMNFTISQTSGGSGIDVDFVAWGPFSSMINACNSLTGSCSPGGTALPQSCTGNIEDCSFSTASVEQMNLMSPGPGNFFIIMITNYDGAAGNITFQQNSGPGTNCNITCPSVLSGPGFVVSPGGGSMPASVACNSPNINLIASSNTPFGNPITPAVIFSMNDNGNASNWIQWLENGTFVLCAGPTANGCGTNLTINANNDIQFSTMSPSATNNFVLCENNTSNPDFPYGIGDAASGTVLNSGTWVDDGNCQTISFPPGTISGVSSWSISPACAGCLATTDWGFATFSPSNAGPGTYNICYSFDPPGSCPTYNYCQSITVTNPYNATWTAPGALCSNGASINLNTLLGGSATTGGTWSGTGVTGSTFNPVTSGAGTFTITYTVGSGACSATQSHTITVNPKPVATATPSSQTICSGSTTGIALSSTVGGTTYSWTVVQTNVSGASAGSGSSIGQTLTATSTSPGTAVYTITPTAGGCTGSPITVTVTVNPKPVATATPSSQTICSGSTTGISLTSNVAGTTFSWGAPTQTGASGGSAGSGSSIAQTLTATGTSAGTVTYTVTPTAGGCTGSPILVTITVNPKPVATATPSSQTFCSGGTTGISLTSNVGGTTFSWTVVQTGVSGASAGSGSSIVQTLSTTGSVSGTAVYTITPTAGSCAGTPITVTITVNPIPVVTATPSSQTICSGSTTGITLSSGVAGTTYNWTVSQSGVSGASNGSGSSITQTLTATGASAGTAVYTITPTAGSCSGTPISVTITVNPKPVVTATPSSQTICSGSSTGITLSSTVAGTSYSWTVTQTGVSGASASSGSSITQTLTATGTTAGTAVYTITPSASGCAGLPVTVTITVNPKPVVTATPASQTFCTGGTTGIGLTSNVSGTSFSWTVVQTGVTGASAGSGSSIAQTLTTTGASAGTAVYTITPTAGGCSGNPITVTITVNPMDNAAFSYGSSTYCQTGTNPTPTVTGLTGGTFTSSPAGLSINASTGLINLAGSSLGSYTVTYTTSGTCPNTSSVTITITSAPSANFTYSGSPFCQNGSNPLPSFGVGASAGTFSGSPAGLVFVNVNTGQINLTASTPGTYTVTNSIAASGGCAPATATFSITINPAPVVTATPSTQTLCSGSSTGIALSSSIGGTTYSWTVVQTGVSGASAGSGSSIAQALSTTGTVPGTAVYTVTPTAGGCPGNPVTITITVNPIPVLTATPTTQTLCSGSVTGIALTSNVSGTTFSWTLTQTGVSGGAAGSGSSISQTLVATGASAGTAVYTVTPTANGCSGTPVTVTITVNPIPFATATPSTQTICSGSTTGIALSSFTAGTTFSWTVSQSGVSGASAGSGSSIAQVLSTTGATPGTATYTITPSANSCVGTPITVTITVNPIPTVTATPTVQTICSGTATSINLSGTVLGSTYSWTVTQTGASGASAGSGTSIAQTLTASGVTAGTVVYTITPSANSCSGTPVTVTVTVNSTPVATATPSSQTICSGNSTSVNLTGNVAGTTFTWTEVETNVTGAASGAGTSISQTLSTTGTTSGTAVYTVTPSANGCPGNPTTVNVTVNPVPTVTATPSSQTICSGTATGISLSSNVSGTTFSWTVTQTGVTGATSGSGASIAQTLNASGVTAGTAVYTITPSATGCPGTPITVTITVNPTPVVTATPTSQTFCDGGTTSIALSTNVSGTTLSWTVVQTGVTGAVAGSGSTSIADVINVTGPATGTAVYTITPSASGCAGTPVNVTITVNPIDDASFSYSSSTYCQTGTNPTATVTGLPGGTFSVSPVGLVLTDPSTGLLDLASSIPGSYTVTYQTNGNCPNTSSITLTITNAPTADFVYNSPVCSSDPNALPTFISGSSAGTFSSSSGLVFVSTNTGEIDLAASTPGTYTILNTITAAGGCAAASYSDTISISQAATVTAGTNASVCEASSYTLAGAIGGSATVGTWTSSGTGTFSSINNPTATYTPSAADVSAGSVQLVFATDDPGGVCGAVADTMILSITPLDNSSFNYGPGTTFCQSGTNPVAVVTGLAGGVFSAAPAGLNFVSTATGEIDLMGSTLGTYDVYYTTNGTCPHTDTVSVTISSAPSATFTFTAGTTAFCQTAPDPSPVFTGGASAGVFTVSPSGLAIDSLTGAISLAGSLPGSYVITNTIAPAGGCAIAMDSLAIIIDPAPIVEAGANGTICAGSTYAVSGDSIGGSTGSVAWTSSGTGTFSAPTSLTTIYTPSAADTAAGMVMLYITSDDPAGACGPVMDSISLTINPTPPAPTVTNTTVNSCFGSAVTPLAATGVGGTFNWYSDSTLTSSVGTGNTYSPGVLTTSGSYWVTETIGTCQGPATQIDVTVHPLPIADTASVVIASADCGAPTGSVVGVNMTSGTAPYSYAWTDSLGGMAGVGADLLNAGPGTYSLTITDANGCSTSVGPYTISSTAGVVASFTANPTTGETPLTVNFSNSSTGAASYLWQFGLTDTSTAVNPSYVIVPLGSFPVCLVAINAAGCTDTACTTIDVYINSVFVIPNVFTPNDDGINDIFGVTGVGLATMDAEIYNRWGQKMYEWHTVNGGWDGRTMAGVLAPEGTYYFIIKATGIDKKAYEEKGSFSLIR